MLQYPYILKISEAYKNTDSHASFNDKICLENYVMKLFYYCMNIMMYTYIT